MCADSRGCGLFTRQLTGFRSKLRRATVNAVKKEQKFALSDEDTWLRVHAWQDLKNFKAVARRLKRDRKTLWRWVMRYSLGKAISAQSGRGRNSSLSDSERARALQPLARKECSRGGELAAKLHSDHSTKQRVVSQTKARVVRLEAESECV